MNNLKFKSTITNDGILKCTAKVKKSLSHSLISKSDNLIKNVITNLQTGISGEFYQEIINELRSIMIEDMENIKGQERIQKMINKLVLK